MLVTTLTNSLLYEELKELLSKSGWQYTENYYHPSLFSIEKSGIWISGSNGYGFDTKSIYTKCDKCGSDIYVNHFMFRIEDQGYANKKTVKKITNLINKLNDEQTRMYKDFLDYPICPHCGGKIDKDSDSYVCFDYSFKDLYFVERYLSRKPYGTVVYSLKYDLTANKFVKCDVKDADALLGGPHRRGIFSFINNVAEKSVNDNVLKRIDNIKSHYVDSLDLNNKKYNINLEEYLGKALSIETAIYSLEERLSSLYYEDIKIKQKSVFEDFRDIYLKESKLREKRKELENVSAKYWAIKNEENSVGCNIKKESVPYLHKPLKPAQPAEPRFKVAGLFNKKKIALENEQIQKDYLIKMEKYNNLMDEYNDKLNKYYQKKESLEAEVEEKYQNDLMREKNKFVLRLRNAEERMESVQLELDKLSYDNNRVTESSRHYLCDFVDAEIEQAESTLKKLYDAKQRFYEVGVVFSKYRSLVPISMFNEYLQSGRCDILTGRDGAYNIYESEMRANIIISKLSDISASLEEIKNNQYMIYSAVKSVNNSLTSLNNKMNTVINKLSSIEENAIGINSSLDKVNNSLEMIAYNTEVTAYYSKLNAQLTDALGYMVAFK